MAKTLIIAEAGVNHNGSLSLAFELVDAAKKAGADVIKFQTFVTDNLVTKDAKQASYQTTNIGKESNQWQMLKQLELSFDEHREVFDYCNAQGIEYLSTAFDLDSLSFLAHEIGSARLKIPSGEITNAPYLLAHARLKLPMILSTGMSNIEEITAALAVIAFGLLENEQPQSLQQCYKAFHSNAGQMALKHYVTLLHCTTQYPTPLQAVNLNAMECMKNTFDLPIGYSDHTEGVLIPCLAVAKGASVIEKHFTLSKALPGPDHKASLEPDELQIMVQQIRETEVALGDGNKQIMPCELGNREVIRKSLIANKAIKQGELFTEDSVAIKRPGVGISPMKYWDLLGKKASRNIPNGQLIDESMLE